MRTMTFLSLTKHKNVIRYTEQENEKIILVWRAESGQSVYLQRDAEMRGQKLCLNSWFVWHS